MEQQTFTTRTATIWLDGRGIIRAEMLPGVEETIDDARANMAVMERLAEGKRPPLLVDLRLMPSQRREVRAFYASPEFARFHSAGVMLIGSPMSKIIGNFFIGINKAPVPVKLFTSEAEAITWLTTFLP